MYHIFFGDTSIITFDIIVNVSYNSRKFHTKNNEPEESYFNVEYCNENIKDRETGGRFFCRLGADVFRSGNYGIYKVVLREESKVTGKENRTSYAFCLFGVSGYFT